MYVCMYVRMYVYRSMNFTFFLFEEYLREKASLFCPETVPRNRLV